MLISIVFVFLILGRNLDGRCKIFSYVENMPLYSELLLGEDMSAFNHHFPGSPYSGYDSKCFCLNSVELKSQEPNVLLQSHCLYNLY